MTDTSDNPSYWHRRAIAETQAALASADAHIAAIHVELATRCLRKAQSDERCDRVASAWEQIGG
jgi:hypothetical protein